MPKNVFIIGITGYIGGSVFTALKAAHPDFTYSALVRNPNHYPAILAAGASPILGTFKDREIIAHQAYEADIVINCADADDVGLTEAILEGARKRKQDGKTVGILIHTSGTAIFSDDTKDGRFREDAKTWNDGNIEDIKSITTEMIHGQVDVPIFKASFAGDVHSYIIAPSGVHGPGTGPLAAGNTSQLVKLLSGIYISAGRVFVIGEGTNLLGYVHIADLVSLYLLVLNHALSFYPHPPPTSPYERYYIGNTRHVSVNTTAVLYAKALYARGKVPSAEVPHIPFEEAGPYAKIFAPNSITKEKRGPALGWVRVGASIEETFEGDIDTLFPKAK